MNELEMIKAFAELEGVKCHIYEGHLVIASRFNEVVNANCSGRLSHGMTQKMLHSAEFNPITELALNCKARDEYGAAIVYHFKEEEVFYVSCYGMLEHIELDKKEDIPRAVIECILKSKGLWK